jgi:glutathione peroxidase
MGLTIDIIKVKKITGEEIELSEYQHKVLLIVNTASQCGFTPQYSQLQELYLKYHDQGLEVLAFPCNQFGQQEPEGEEKIKEFCETSFGTTFPLFAKVEVNGAGTHPLYQYLKTSLPGILGTTAIKWNFTKFLIDSQGNPYKRYAPNQSPLSLEEDIVALLKQKQKQKQS